ncbi:FtsX-like permease family protein [Nocardioides marmoriginsengisoli]|uniref:FtsX-like permease family protein n=1 Tax=Nocardioides marmoriginsengisoli TaxID=661483 RepID=A0A3N0CBM9_9ACTN|nr:FtsX-like permease family protein [Nocardioides marmoriginsengisoli]RNL60466.1 FtsX-like permease family protein [Nocardioides marmoriginsengisoli]
MRTVLLASLRVHTRRYLAAALAIAVGVAFIVVTNALASAARDGIVAGVDLPYRDADAVVSDIDGSQAAALVDRARERGDSAAVLGWTMQQVSGDGIVADQVDVGAVADDSRMRWQRLVDGRMPRADGEAVVDVNAAKSLQAAVGDVIRVGSGARAAEVEVVGTVDSPSASVSSSVYLTWDAVSAITPRFFVDSVAYAAAGNTGGLVPALRAATDGTVQSVDDFVDDRTQELAQGVDVLGYLLLLFAGIALFVSVLVIANTFSILFAQRTRDFALLRCVGSTRGQLLRSVRREALVLGALASALGLAVGAALGYGVVALVAALIPRAPLGAVSLDPRWLLSAYGLGVLVTLVASWLPTRRVSQVSPLVALRTEEVAEVSAAAGRMRLVLAAGSLAAGLAGMGVAVASESAPAMVLGGGLSFIGVLLLGPLVVPALVRLIGGAAGRFGGPAMRLATGNAVRQPRRTAATTASLLIGVTLTTAVLTGLAGARTSLDDEMKSEHPVDVTLTGSTATPLPGDLLADVRGADGVQDAAAVPGVLAKVSNGVGSLTLLAPPGDARVVERAALPRPGPRELVLPYDVAPDAGRVTVLVGDRKVRLKVRTSEGFGTAGLVAPETLRALGSDGTRAVWVRADDDADPEDLGGDLDALAGPVAADVESGLQQRAYVTRQLTILTGAVVGLLGVAVVIALVGIGNTLGLSVLERRREHALLRALGLTRRQLRATLAAEAVLLSVVATVLGTVLGVGYAWVGDLTLIRPAVGGGLRIPWDQLAIVVLVAGVAGLAACVLPARRAARTAPAEGLAAD